VSAHLVFFFFFLFFSQFCFVLFCFSWPKLKPGLLFGFLPNRSFPQCLYFLELLQDKGFRDLLLNNNVIEWLHHQQYHFWCKHGARGTQPAQQETT